MNSWEGMSHIDCAGWGVGVSSCRPRESWGDRSEVPDSTFYSNLVQKDILNSTKCCQGVWTLKSIISVTLPSVCSTHDWCMPFQPNKAHEFPFFFVFTGVSQKFKNGVACFSLPSTTSISTPNPKSCANVQPSSFTSAIHKHRLRRYQTLHRHSERPQLGPWHQLHLGGHKCQRPRIQRLPAQPRVLHASLLQRATEKVLLFSPCEYQHHLHSGVHLLVWQLRQPRQTPQVHDVHWCHRGARNRPHGCRGCQLSIAEGVHRQNRS